MSRVKCFLVEPLDRANLHLRRFQFGSVQKCEGKLGYHNAVSGVIQQIDGIYTQHDQIGKVIRHYPVEDFAEHPDWPTKCEHCDYVFTEEDEYQVRVEDLWFAPETGETYSRRKMPPGAMYYAWWNTFWVGPDGKSLEVILPDGVNWNIDSRANNCTKPGDNVHKCWVRHGTPPNITVDKTGNTCAAGAGSIATKGYHGFLRNGYLESC